MTTQTTTSQKAFEINMDPAIYGTIAEIGAGQEVSRNFFLAGGAAGTIAKSISAYDMNMSDSLYGRDDSGRYVVESRLRKMLETEYDLVLRHVSEHRPKNSLYFAFADTVTARSYLRPSAECHGWMGICLQAQPGAPPSRIILHVRMLDESNREQQEAVGILGVNLIHGAFHHLRSPERLIDTLRDNLERGRIEIDVIRMEGNGFEWLDNRLVALHLLEAGLTRAVLFSTGKDVVLPSEVLYKQNILVHRSNFYPVTNVTVDMIRSGMASFRKYFNLGEDNAEVLPEISLAEMRSYGKTDLAEMRFAGKIDKAHVLHRADTVSLLGNPLLVTTYLRFFRIREYLNRYTQGNIGFVLGVPNVLLIFNDEYYADLEGGIMGAFAKLFDGRTKLFVYPQRKGSSILNADVCPVPSHLQHLYLYLRENRMIEAVDDFDEKVLHIWPEEIQQKLKKGRGDWEGMVPPTVAEAVIRDRLFGFGTEK